MLSKYVQDMYLFYYQKRISLYVLYRLPALNGTYKYDSKSGQFHHKCSDLRDAIFEVSNRQIRFYSVSNLLPAWQLRRQIPVKDRLTRLKALSYRTFNHWCSPATRKVLPAVDPSLRAHSRAAHLAILDAACLFPSDFIL